MVLDGDEGAGGELMAEGLRVVVGGNALPIIAAAGRNAPKELQWLATRVALMISREAKIKVKSVLNTTGKATGNLGRGITVIARPPMAAEVGPQAIYGAIHEFGGKIVPKNAKALAFWAPGNLVKGGVRKNIGAASEFVMVQSVTMPKRSYMGPATETVKPQVPRVVEERVKKLMGGG